MSSPPPPPTTPPRNPEEDELQPSRLLALPVELQLNIYELALISSDILLLNCPCDSSYHHNHAAWDADKQAWASSEKHAPAQPGLTRTCKALRALTLPLFYQENRFRAHYCNTADFAAAERWLEAIGPRNRACLRRMWLFDENPKQDRHWPRDIEGEKETLRERFGAVLEPAVIDENVRHRVVLPGAL